MSLTLGAQQAGALTNDDTTRLITAGSLAYTFGKIFGGSCADLLGGKQTISVVMTTMGACFVATGFHGSTSAKPSARAITMLWCLSRVVHAAHWPAHCVVNKAWFSMDTDFSARTAILSTSSRLGSFFGSLAGGVLLSRLGSWSSCLKVVGAYLLLLGGVDIMTLTQPTVEETNKGVVEAKKILDKAMSKVSKKRERNERDERAAAERKRERDSAEERAKRETVTSDQNKKRLKPGGWWRALTNPKLYLVFAGTALSFPAYDLPAILPVLLSEHVKGLSTTSIGLIGSMFPVMAVPSIFFGAWLEPQLTSTTRPMWYAGGAMVASLCLLRLSKKGLSPSFIAPLLMTTMFSFAPAIAFVPPEFLAKFGGPQTGLFTGLNDAGGMLLNSTIYAMLPALKRRGGWTLVLKTYAGMMAASGACNAGYYLLERRNPLVVSPFEEEE